MKRFILILIIIVTICFLNSYVSACNTPDSAPDTADAPAPSAPSPSGISAPSPSPDPPAANGNAGIENYPIPCQDGIFEKCPEPKLKVNVERQEMLKQILIYILEKEAIHELISEPILKPMSEKDGDKYRWIYRPEWWKEE